MLHLPEPAMHTNTLMMCGKRPPHAVLLALPPPLCPLPLRSPPVRPHSDAACRPRLVRAPAGMHQSLALLPTSKPPPAPHKRPGQCTSHSTHCNILRAPSLETACQGPRTSELRIGTTAAVLDPSCVSDPPQPLFTPSTRPRLRAVGCERRRGYRGGRGGTRGGARLHSSWAARGRLQAQSYSHR